MELRRNYYFCVVGMSFWFASILYHGRVECASVRYEIAVRMTFRRLVRDCALWWFSLDCRLLCPTGRSSRHKHGDWPVCVCVHRYARHVAVCVYRLYGDVPVPVLYRIQSLCLCAECTQMAHYALVAHTYLPCFTHNNSGPPSPGEKLETVRFQADVSSRLSPHLWIVVGFALSGDFACPT